MCLLATCTLQRCVTMGNASCARLLSCALSLSMELSKLAEKNEEFDLQSKEFGFEIRAGHLRSSVRFLVIIFSIYKTVAG